MEEEEETCSSAHTIPCRSFLFRNFFVTKKEGKVGGFYSMCLCVCVETVEMG